MLLFFLKRNCFQGWHIQVICTYIHHFIHTHTSAADVYNAFLYWMDYFEWQLHETNLLPANWRTFSYIQCINGKTFVNKQLYCVPLIMNVCSVIIYNEAIIYTQVAKQINIFNVLFAWYSSWWFLTLLFICLQDVKTYCCLSKRVIFMYVVLMQWTPWQNSIPSIFYGVQKKLQWSGL